MNLQGVSEICFEEVYTVPADQTVNRLFARLPHSTHYAGTLIEALATGYLIAVIESICIREMQRHIDPAVETVVGTSVNLEHCAPTPAGARLTLRGWTEQIGDRDAIFRVQVHDEHDVVCEGTLKFVAVRRDCITRRILLKGGSRQAAREDAPGSAA